MTVRVAQPVYTTGTIPNYAATGTTLTANLTNVYAHPVPGDLVVAFCNYFVANTTDPTATFEGSSMTMIGSRQDYGTNRHVAVFTAPVTNLGSSIGGVTFTFPASVSNACGLAFVVSGQDGTPLDVSVVQSFNSIGTSHPFGPITPVSDNVLLLALVGGDNDNGAGASTFTTSITDWTNLDNGGTTAGSDGSIGVWYRNLATPAATSITVTSGASVNSGGFLLAIRPAATEPLGDLLPSRSLSARGPNASGGFTATPSGFLTVYRHTLVDSSDVVLLVYAYRDSPNSILSLSSPTGWEMIRETADATSTFTIQVYAKAYTTGMTIPSVTTSATTDRFWCFALVLRNVNLSDILDVDSVTFDASSSSTLTYPDATVAGNNLVLRMAFLYDDAPYPTTEGDDGSKVWINPKMAGFSTATGLDQGLIVNARSVASAGALGTEGQTINSAIGSTLYTLVLNLNAPIVELEAIFEGAGEVVAEFSIGSGTVAFEEAIVTGEAEVEASFTSFRRNSRVRSRPLVWVKNYLGEVVNVLD